MTKYNSRALISFEGKCPMNCRHCYTYELDSQQTNYDIPTIISKLSPKNFDIIYISQRYENFYDQDCGYSLCNELFTQFHKDIFIITRSFLSDNMISNLCSLNKKMRSEGNNLILAVSVCADMSYTLTENANICPTPIQRMQNIQRAHLGGIKTVLMLRPIFPNTIIPVSECTSLISQFSAYIDAVVTSGLIVTDGILERLQLDKASLSFMSHGDSSYLADLKGKEVLYLDVETELQEVERCCTIAGIPCFRHSMPALNAITQ